MKTLAPALAVLTLLATPALAQQAAATLPDTVGDRPLQVPPAPVAPTDDRAIERAEAALRSQIAAMQAGAPDYDAMTPGLAEAVREQEPVVTPLIVGFGDLETVVHAGAENGAELFAVTFEKAATQWIIGLNAEGKISALLFRPAPETAETAE